MSARAPGIITNETREMVASLEENTGTDPELSFMLTRDLVGHLAARCCDPDIREKYEHYGDHAPDLSVYPIAEDGFAEAFDILTQEQEMYDHWLEKGVVVGLKVAHSDTCLAAIKRIHEISSVVSDGRFNIDDPQTYDQIPTDQSGVPIMTRGFFEIYHDDSLAQLRQSVRSYLHHVVLWGGADLWTTYDRLGVKLPGHDESGALPLHVDQNPLEHPDFRTVQGVLALDDCPLERGTFVAVPGSKGHFSEYEQIAPSRGEYVELDMSAPIAERLAEHAQPIPLRAGDIVSWDSRTTHANTANTSELVRYMALISAGPARQQDLGAVRVRQEGFESGLGSNVRDALMHASKRPRFTDANVAAESRQPEQLTPLGRLLYGIEEYDD